MQDFNYIAKNEDGEIQKGVVEAESESAASSVLISRKLYPTKITAIKANNFNFFNRIGIKEKVFFMRQLATIINAGLPIAQALKILEQQTNNKNLKALIASVARDVDGGMALSVALSSYPRIFPQIDITLIQSGETSGNLDKALTRLASTLENDYKIRKKIRGAFIYPAVILIVITAVLIIMVVYVLPQMEDLFASFNAKLPLLTRIILAVSNGLTKYGIILVVVVAALVFGIRAFIRTPTGRYNWDKMKLSIPIVKDFMTKLYISRMTRTLSGLVASGVDILESINIVSRSIGNKIFEDILLEAGEKVKSGTALSVVLKDHPEFPAIVPQMIRVGEESGEMDEMLTNLADYYENEVTDFVNNLTTILEPVLMVVMGIVVGVILVGIMLPVYSIGRVIK
ncbi:MAG: type II secretion system F family protein [Patescibacteria group bacterium]|nr:type II secretion system F family protein [Patescibacteria group bacterium]